MAATRQLKHEYNLRKLNHQELKNLFITVRGEIIHSQKNKNYDSNDKKELEIFYCYICKEIEEREKINLNYV
tara:strand:- start:507 stop:722 length:216 start_codon:yes stop_codon:yes gene_type:complete